jgi:hypothetical protein
VRVCCAPPGSRLVASLLAGSLLATLSLTGCSASTPSDGASPSSGAAATGSGPPHKPSAIDLAPEPDTLPTTRDAVAASNSRRNEIGEPWTLDEAAAAACAQAEFAMSALEDGRDPGAYLAAAVTAAGPSTTEDVQAAAVGLAAAPVGRAEVVSFLRVCTEGGYEL